MARFPKYPPDKTMADKKLDIVLLQIFETIMAERNISRAADRLNLSQSAVSKGLANLRILFKDQLFVRSGAGVTPTHKAIELSERVSSSVYLLNTLLTDDVPFDPRSNRSSFTIGTSDYGSYLLLPTLVSTIIKLAPEVKIYAKVIDNRTAEELLLTSQVDLCLASHAAFTYPIQTTELFKDTYVCLARKGHPIEDSEFTIQSFLKYRHLIMPKQSGGALGVVEQALSQTKLSRQVAISVSSLLSVPEILTSTDLLMTTTSRLARKMMRDAPLAIHPHPLNLDSFCYFQLWHQRNGNSASHQWLRQLISDCVLKI